jgi:hypothetical protein
VSTSNDLTQIERLDEWLAHATQWGTADPYELRRLLVNDVVAEAIAVQPRSLQREIGPSELGIPCERKLAHKFAGTAATGLAAPKWLAAIGTAVHRDFSEWCQAYNARHGTRFLTDLRVMVGNLFAEFGGWRPITGSLDALDIVTGTIIDLKVPGITQIRKYAGSAPENPVYRIQTNSYGNGTRNAGFPVAHCAILRLPRSGELSQAGLKLMPHDPADADQALARVGRIAKMVELGGVDIIPHFEKREHYCGGCEYFDPLATDERFGCTGVMETTNGSGQYGGLKAPPKAMTDLIG